MGDRAQGGGPPTDLGQSMIHLDTGFLIRALQTESPEDYRLRGWLRDGTRPGISAVAWTEFLCGPVSASDLKLAMEIVGRCLEFTPEHATEAAILFNRSGRRRGTLVDCMIAAVALGEGAAVATTNPDDFRRFRDSGLELA